MLLFVVALVLGIPLIVEYERTGLVPRFPTAILCSGLVATAAVCAATGLILDLVSHVRREVKLLAYLRYPVAGAEPESDS
jgi:spore maturation protein SpmA